MEHAKILAIVARLMVIGEADGLICRVDSVAIPSRTTQGAIVDCIGNGRYRTFAVSPSGRVAFVAGRVL